MRGQSETKCRPLTRLALRARHPLPQGERGSAHDARDAKQTCVIARVLCPAPGRPHSQIAFPACAPITRARGTPGPERPRSSVHGVCRKCTDVVTTELPDPRRPARGVYRFAPHGPRWTDLSGAPPQEHLSTAAGLVGCLRRLLRRVRGPLRDVSRLCPLPIGLTPQWRTVSAPGPSGLDRGLST